MQPVSCGAYCASLCAVINRCCFEFDGLIRTTHGGIVLNQHSVLACSDYLYSPRAQGQMELIHTIHKRFYPVSGRPIILVTLVHGTENRLPASARPSNSLAIAQPVAEILIIVTTSLAKV